jgi:glycosyltransferase involved in cell wall biosynthesis
VESREVAENLFVSIVICTYNRKKLLKDCLNSIFAMDYPKSYYEIIIVDGGSNDGTNELCEQFPEIRFVTESRFGLAYARNKGADLARGSIVAYTDDDCIVDKYWLTNLVLGFQHSQSIAGVGGPVFPTHLEIIPKQILVKAALGLYDDGNHPKLTGGIITSNSAFRKEVFKEIRFDESLGATRRGKLILCGEDTDFCKTLTAFRFMILYNPYAKVYHQVPRNRLRVPYIVKHATHNGITRTRMNLKNCSRVRAIRFAIGQLVQYGLKIPFDPSFTSCYNLVYCISTFFASLTGLDKLFSENSFKSV